MHGSILCKVRALLSSCCLLVPRWLATDEQHVPKIPMSRSSYSFAANEHSEAKAIPNSGEFAHVIEMLASRFMSLEPRNFKQKKSLNRIPASLLRGASSAAPEQSSPSKFSSQKRELIYQSKLLKGGYIGDYIGDYYRVY